MNDALNRADENGFTSIAFPALGTGALHFPFRVVASIMFNVVRNFGEMHPKSRLKDVRFVIYDKDKDGIQVNTFLTLYRLFCLG